MGICGGKSSTVDNRSTPQAPTRKTVTGKTDIHRVYQIGDVKGHGHFGTVRLVTHRETGRKYALKSIDKIKFKGDGELQMLKSELDVLRTVDHPNIIKFYETYEDKHNFHLVMEYCDGGEMFDRIVSRGRYTERDAAVTMRKLISAINHCHEAHIVHRDLKPENFLYETKEDNAEIKIIDFGLSTKFGPGDAAMTSVVGTPFYVAPEVLKGSYDQACDMWSLGVILFILLCGEPPFNGENNQEIFQRIARCDYKFEHQSWSQVSAEAKDLVVKLLQKDPRKRLTAAQALQHPWLASTAPKYNLDFNIVNSLRLYSNSRKFKREALGFIVKMLPDHEVATLKAQFQAIDTDNTGTISADELYDALRKVEVELSREEVDQIMKNVDFDGNGRINYSEFLAATMDMKKFLTKDKLMMAFKHFDTDSTGFITAENLKDAFKRAGRDVTDDELRQMIKEADEGPGGNRDGKVSLEEFTKMMMQGFKDNA